MQQQTYKVVMIGNASVGKTSIINQYIGLPLCDDVTVFANFKALPVVFTKNQQEKRVKLHITDTCGTEKYNNNMMSSYYRQAHAGIIVFDINDPESLQNLSKRLTQFIDYARQDSVLVIVGNKYDLVSGSDSSLAFQLLDQNVKEIMNTHCITLYIKTSALTGYNINTLFEQLSIILDTVYPQDQFQIIQNEQIASFSISNLITQRTGWSCF